MENVAFSVDHEVAVVSVLDLQNVAEQVVGSQRRDEVVLGLSVPPTVLFSKLLNKVSLQRAFQGFANLVSRLAVRNALYDAILEKHN